MLSISQVHERSFPTTAPLVHCLRLAMCGEWMQWAICVVVLWRALQTQLNCRREILWLVLCKRVHFRLGKIQMFQFRCRIRCERICVSQYQAVSPGLLACANNIITTKTGNAPMELPPRRLLCVRHFVRRSPHDFLRRPIAFGLCRFIAFSQIAPMIHERPDFSTEASCDSRESVCLFLGHRPPLFG